MLKLVVNGVTDRCQCDRQMSVWQQASVQLVCDDHWWISMTDWCFCGSWISGAPDTWTGYWLGSHLRDKGKDASTWLWQEGIAKVSVAFETSFPVLYHCLSDWPSVTICCSRVLDKELLQVPLEDCQGCDTEDDGMTCLSRAQQVVVFRLQIGRSKLLAQLHRIKIQRWHPDSWAHTSIMPSFCTTDIKPGTNWCLAGEAVELGGVPGVDFAMATSRTI